MADEPEVVKENTVPSEALPPAANKAPRRTADQPHTVSLALSIAAVVISLISWRESYASRVASQSASRAVLEAVDASIAPNPSPEGKRDIEVTMKNVGRAAAHAVGFWWGVEVNHSTPIEEFRHSPHYFNPSNPKMTKFKPFNTEIPPGAHSRLFFAVDLDTPDPPGPLADALVYLVGAIEWVV